MLQHCDDAFHVMCMTHKPWTDDSGSHLHHHGVVLAFVMCVSDRAEEHVWPTDQEASVQPSRHTHLVKSWHHSFHAEQQVTVSHLRFCVRTSFAKPHETLPVMQVLVVTDTSTISSGRVWSSVANVFSLAIIHWPTKNPAAKLPAASADSINTINMKLVFSSSSFFALAPITTL